jgi:opacity protein-like surface antigen
LLADSYAALPRHEIARVSELLQSQLLQPINITPIQPRLGESNLFLISAQGPATLSFNEFNPLFNRNRIALQASGLAGEDDTWSGEGIVSAIYDKASFSGGFTYFDTDGFRPNNQLQDDIGTAFAQVELTPQTSVQAEYRYRKRENGDLELRFFEDDFSRFFDADIESHTGRFGLRHAFSPRSVLLASYVYQDKDIHESDLAPGNPVVTWRPGCDPFAFPPEDPPCIPSDFGPDNSLDSETHENAHSIEGQYLYRSPPLEGWIRNVKVTTGIGYFDIDKKVRETHAFSETEIKGFPFCGGCDQVFPGGVVSDELTHPDVQHVNLYLYSYLSFPENVTVTLGLSGDNIHVEGTSDDAGEANPKFGLQWDPSFIPGMTVRAAAFRMTKRTLVTNQTLEPTQVAGFNQFFDDVNGTHGWRYGGAIDQKFTDSIFGGVEYSERDLNVPATLSGIGSVKTEADWDEQLARAYFFWAPCDWLAFRAEYQWEKFKRDPLLDDVFFAFKEVETHRVPFGVQFFHPIGISAMLGATWLDQSGEFFREDSPVAPTGILEKGSRSFWVLDTALRYRLPKRYGFVSFGVNNVLDEDSTYQATDVRNPDIRPGRFIFGSVTLSFP